MKLNRTWPLVALFVCLPLLVQAQTKPAQVEQALSSALKAEQKAQQSVDKWTGERADLLAQISQEKNRLRWLERQRRKFEGYLKRQEAVIAELDRRREELNRINLELEPYLEEVVDRLAAFVESDLDFLPEERARRLDFVRRSLGDYRLGLSEKLRRTMEALQVEAAYGHGLDKTEVELEIDGQLTRVDVLRLGRLALYYQTLDGQKLGWRPRGALEWRPLPRGYRRELTKALDMAQRRRAVELVTLPVGRPQP